jgi:hypothetical protein
VSERRISGAVLAVPLMCLLVLTGCSSSPTPTSAPPSADPATGASMPTHDGTPITLTIGDRVVAGTLHDNPAANALAQRLPMTLTFDDFGAVEKIAPLASPLPMTGMPAGADPEIGDIGFWAPGGDLVLYYGEVGYWNGIARLGTFDDVAAIEGQTGPFTITIATA